MLSPRPYVLAALLSVAATTVVRAQKVELPKCDTDTLKEKVTRFEVTLPVPPGRAYGRVVRAFIQIGLTPSNAASMTSQVDWNSGVETNAWTGDNRARRITATIIDDDDDENKSLVIIAPYEGTVEGMTDQKSMLPLSNKNGGYGKKVWCAAAAITDTLRVAAAKMARRNAGAAAVDSADTSSVAGDKKTVPTP